MTLSAKTRAELLLTARHVATMPYDPDAFDHADLVGAALDFATGEARWEVESAVLERGYLAVLAEAEQVIPASLLRGYRVQVR